MLGFAGVGVIGTAVHYLVLVVAASLAHQDPVAASIAGALVGALVNYALNHRYTYQSDKQHRETGPRFALVAGGGFVLNAALMKLLVHGLGWPYFPAQLGVTGVVFFWNFLINHFWTFRAGH